MNTATTARISLFFLLSANLAGCGFKVEKDPQSVSANPQPAAVQVEIPKLIPGRVYGFKTLQPTVFKMRCDGCHMAGGHKGGISLDTYESATTQDALAKIKTEVVVKKSMPPKKVSKMTDDERTMVAQWLAAGAPENDVDESVSPPEASPSPSPSVSLTPVGKFTYADVRDRIFTSQCIKCHGETSGHAEDGVVLTNYADVKGNLDDIQEASVDGNDMPPERPLSESDRALLKAWIDQGAQP